MQSSIDLLAARDLPAFRRAGRAAAETLALVGTRIAPGVRTAEIDQWVRAVTERLGGRPSQLGYHGFPAAVCVSRNQVVCHGIPGSERLRDGDIVNVDVTTELAAPSSLRGTVFCTARTRFCMVRPRPIPAAAM